MNQATPESKTILRLRLEAPADLLDAISGCLFEAGATGILEEDGGLTVYADDEEELTRLKNALNELEAAFIQEGRANPMKTTVDRVKDTWSETWQSALVPEQLTPRFTFRPTHATPAPAGEETIWFEPSTSFGAGEHATTRLAAKFIESHLASNPGIHGFDVGTGSGVLAFVAALCGAEQMLAVDIDEVAVRAAETNAELNELEPLVTVGHGSADSTEETFDLVIANINTPILLQLCAPLAARVNRTGTLVLTGLLVEEMPSLEKSFGARGLRKSAQDTSGDWGLLAFSRS